MTAQVANTKTLKLGHGFRKSMELTLTLNNFAYHIKFHFWTSHKFSTKLFVVDLKIRPHILVMIVLKQICSVFSHSTLILLVQREMQEIDGERPL